MEIEGETDMEREREKERLREGKGILAGEKIEVKSVK